MTAVKTTVFAVILTLTLTACTHEGPRLTESAEVLDLVYTPSSTGTATGVTTSGDFHVSTVTTNARYSVVLGCQHGKFVVEGDDDMHEALWKRLRKGDHVVTEYAERLDRNGERVGFKFYGVR